MDVCYKFVAYADYWISMKFVIDEGLEEHRLFTLFDLFHSGEVASET